MGRLRNLGLVVLAAASSLASKDSPQRQDSAHYDGAFVVLQTPSAQDKATLERMLKVVPVPEKDYTPRQINIDLPELIFEVPMEAYQNQVRLRQTDPLIGGNGILLNQEGYVITNRHVIARAIVAVQDGKSNTHAVFYSPKRRFIAIIEPVAYSTTLDVALGKVAVPWQCRIPDTVIAEPKNFEGTWVGLSRLNTPSSTSSFFNNQILPLISYDAGVQRWNVTQTAPLDFDTKYVATLEHGYVVDMKSKDASFQNSGRLCFAWPADSNDAHSIPLASRQYVFEGNSGTPVFNAYHQYMGPVRGETKITGNNDEVTILPDFIGPKSVRALISAVLQETK